MPEESTTSDLVDVESVALAEDAEALRAAGPQGSGAGVR
jgi:hypothetical protein